MSSKRRPASTNETKPNAPDVVERHESSSPLLGVDWSSLEKDGTPTLAGKELTAELRKTFEKLATLLEAAANISKTDPSKPVPGLAQKSWIPGTEDELDSAGMWVVENFTNRNSLASGFRITVVDGHKVLGKLVVSTQNMIGQVLKQAQRNFRIAAEEENTNG